MNVLVACEESQRVCTAFRERGHIAYSCDIQPCSGGHPEWHILGDVLPLLNGYCGFHSADGLYHYLNAKWDLIIAHPPCTDLAVSGAAWFERKRISGEQRKSVEFFCKFLEADCDRICIENPVGIISGTYVYEYFPDIARKFNLPKKPTQCIQPWQFGDNFAKKTCLWLKGLSPLQPSVTEEPELEYFEWVDKYGRKKRQAKWYYDSLPLPAAERAKVRSKTFPGIAKAMADQWG